MALLPLLWLGVLGFYGQHRTLHWWALAIVLSVSWVADTLAHQLPRGDPRIWTVSAFYPLVQAAIFGTILLPTPALWRFIGVLAVTGLAVGFWRATPEVLGRTVAWTAVLMLAWPHRPVRGPVLVTFGLGWLAWLAYNVAPSWGTWGVFQGVRALGLGAFCYATMPERARA